MEDLIPVGQLSIAFVIGFGLAVALTFPALSKAAKEVEQADLEIAKLEGKLEVSYLLRAEQEDKFNELVADGRYSISGEAVGLKPLKTRPPKGG